MVWKEIFDNHIALLKDDENVADDSVFTVFNNTVKGFKIVPEAGNTSLVYSSNNPQGEQLNSIVRFFYRDNQSNLDTLTYFFNTFASFNEVSPNANSGWTNGRFSTITSSYEPVVLDDPNVYIHAGANLFASVDLAPFLNFTDTIPSGVIVQNAQLFINGDSTLLDNRFRTPAGLSVTLTSDEELENSEFSVIPTGTLFGPNSPFNEVPVNLPYDNDSVNVIATAIYLKEVITAGTGLNRIIFKSAFDRELSRVIIPKDSIFLRVFYNSID